MIARSTDTSVRVRTPEAARLAELITAAGGTAKAGRATAGRAGRPGNGAGLLTVTGMPAPRIGEIAASASIVLHELTPMASLEEAFMELTPAASSSAGSDAPGQPPRQPNPVNATQGSAR